MPDRIERIAEKKGTKKGNRQKKGAVPFSKDGGSPLFFCRGLIHQASLQDVIVSD